MMVDFDGVEEVGFAAAQGFVGEFADFQMKGFPVKAVGQFGGQVVLEEADRHVPPGECLLEKLVMRVVCGFVAHRCLSGAGGQVYVMGSSHFTLRLRLRGGQGHEGVEPPAEGEGDDFGNAGHGKF